MRRPLAYLGMVALLAATCFVAGSLGLKVASVRGTSILVWAPTGIALVALLRVGYRLWPGVLLGALLTNLGAGLPAGVAGAISLASTAEALLGAFLMRRFCRTPNFLESARDVFVFVAVVAPVSTLICALGGATLLLLGGVSTSAEYGKDVLTWWIGAALGALVWGPFLLAWTGKGLSWERWRVIEGTAVIALLILVDGVVFARWFPLLVVESQSPLTFLPVPIVFWAAYRFGLLGAGTATAISAAFAVFGTLVGGGPFVRETMPESLFLQQAFVGVVAVAALILAAVRSERDQAEDELRRARDELNDRVRERTAELVMANEWLVKAFAERERSHGQLRESERLASIGTLATGIANEINNPLGAILVSAESALVAEQAAEGGETTTALNVIIEQAERGGRIVKSVLQFARREPAERWPNDINKVIRTALDMIRSNVDKTGARVRLELDDSLPDVQLNPFEIQQVFINILQNSIDVGDARTRIGVRSKRTRSGVRVTIDDNGPGLSEHEQRRIFDPFYTTRQKQGGTGLGLAIAHGIVSQHQGEIWVESELGLGARLMVELPLDSATPG